MQIDKNMMERARLIGMMSELASNMPADLNGPMALSFLAEYLARQADQISREDRAMLASVGASLIIADWPNMERFTKDVATH